MVELVRDIRSSVGYGDGEFATFALDCGSEIFRAFINEQKKRIGGYDYVFNTSALKHVRSEKDPFTLMQSDTTGEKDFEEFYTENETIVMDKFDSLGVIKNEINYEEEKLQHFTNTIAAMKKKGEWTRGELIDLFNYMIPNFNHKETGKFLDSRM